MLSICYEGIAIPLFWKLLKKAGTTTAKEQIELVSRFVNPFGKESIQGLLGDREFPNKELIEWLVSEDIPFYLRIKGDVQFFGQTLYLAGSKNSREELMIVVTNQHPKNAIACYLRRWEIECLFSALKTKGWRFEDTRIIEPKRIEKLLALLTVGFVWAHKIGEWKASIKPITLKKIRNQKRPKSSFFRFGLDHLRNLLTSSTASIKLFSKFLKCLFIELVETAF